ncbi:unnamed protein product, partial [Prorocentrum cordatum]
MATLTTGGRYQMWALKDIRAHDTFGGAQDGFESYFFTMEAEVTEMGWRHLYDAAVTHVGPISSESITNEETRELSRNLGTFLAMTKLAGAGNGFEALRRIYADYRPQGGTFEHSLLTTTVQPKWWSSDDQSRRSFAYVLHDWGHLVTQHELASQEKILDIMTCATILGYAPLQIREALDGASQEVRDNYAVMRTGPIARHLLSAGRVFDAGFDAVYPRSEGDMEDAKHEVKKAKRLAGDRSSKVAMGVVAASEDVEMKDVGAVQADGAGAPAPMAEGAGSASSGSGGAAPAAPEGGLPAAAGPAEGPPAPKAEKKVVGDPEGAELGPGTRVDLLRACLRELGGAVYGAKKELWTHLFQCEHKRKQDLEFKKAVEERYRQQVDGQPVTEAKVVDGPYSPTDTENVCDEADGSWHVLVVADRSAGFLCGSAPGNEAADDCATKQLMRFMKHLAYQKPEPRRDAEPPAKALQDKVVSARSEENLETRVSQGKTGDSQSMGFIGARIRWWRGHLKANRVQVEMNYGIKLAPHSPLWPFLAHHAANVTNWLSRDAGGYAAYFAVSGVNYTGVVAPFAETVMARTPKGKRHDKDMLPKVCGEPWKERIARMPRSLVMGGDKGEVAPTPLEAAGAEAKKARVEGLIAGAIENISGQLDYKTLLTAEELTHWDSSGSPMEEVAEAIEKGLKLCDEFGIYSVHPRGAADGKKKVDAKCGGGGDRAGALKYRFVGREFAWLEERGDLFAPGSTTLTVGDVTSACYQVPEKEEFYCDPPPEWLAARAKAGLDVNVVWELETQLPGRGDASREWVGYVADHRLICGLSRNDACPQFYRKPITRWSLEFHMGDFFCAGRKGEVGGFFPAIRAKLKLKDSDVVIEGRFEYLKHQKQSSHIIAELGLRGANPVRTVEHSPPLVDRQIARYRSRVGSGLYLAQDRADIRGGAGALAADLAAPTELPWKRPLRLGRYLVGTSDLGVFLPKVDAKICKKGVVHLRAFSDSDHGGKEAKRKSATCGVLHADGVILATLVRRQDLIAVSSGESEFCALSTVATGGKMLRDLLTWSGFRAEWTLETDSSAARSMSLRRGVGKVRHLDTRALWVQQATRLHNLRVVKRKGTQNPADIGTKSRTAEVHEQVEVHAVIEKVARTARGVQFGGKVPSSPTLNTAILALCLAIQAQQGEAVDNIGSEDNYGYMFVPMLVFLSWLVVFAMGCAAGCCCFGGRSKIEPPPGATDSRNGALVPAGMRVRRDRPRLRGGDPVYHLEGDNHVLHLDRGCQFFEAFVMSITASGSARFAKI